MLLLFPAGLYHIITATDIRFSHFVLLCIRPKPMLDRTITKLSSGQNCAKTSLKMNEEDNIQQKLNFEKKEYFSVIENYFCKKN